MVIIEGLEARKALYLTVQSIDILSEISWYLKIFCKEPCPFNQPPSPSSNCQLSCGHRSLRSVKPLGHGLYQNGASAQLCLADALLLRKGRTLGFTGIRPGLFSTLQGPCSDKAHGLRFLYT